MYIFAFDVITQEQRKSTETVCFRTISVLFPLARREGFEPPAFWSVAIEKLCYTNVLLVS